MIIQSIPIPMLDGGNNGYTAHRSFNGSTDMANTVDEGN